MLGRWGGGEGGKYGVPIRWKGVSKDMKFSTPSFVSLSASSMHVIFSWARSFLMVML